MQSNYAVTFLLRRCVVVVYISCFFNKGQIVDLMLSQTHSVAKNTFTGMLPDVFLLRVAATTVNKIEQTVTCDHSVTLFVYIQPFCSTNQLFSDNLLQDRFSFIDQTSLVYLNQYVIIQLRPIGIIIQRAKLLDPDWLMRRAFFLN